MWCAAALEESIFCLAVFKSLKRDAFLTASLRKTLGSELTDTGSG